MIDIVWRNLRRFLAGGLAAAVLASGVALAEDPGLADLKARLEALEKQNQELQQAIKTNQAPTAVEDRSADGVDKKAVEKIVADALKKKDEEKAIKDAQKKCEDEHKKEMEKREKEDCGVKVGSEMGVTAKFNEYGYLWLSTPNNDFRMHVGMWLQYDNVGWTQNPFLRNPQGGRPGAAQGVFTGANLGGIGNLQDGMYFRRIRPFMEGTLWETIEYRCNLALENDQFFTTGLDEMWIGVNYIPLIGTVRIGHVKDVLGLEADMSGSSRSMTFMERSSYSESIEQNQNFVTGLWLSNHFLDDRMTYSAAMFRTDLGASSGAYFGDGQWGAGLRLTALPWYTEDGRDWCHVGVAGGWRNGQNNTTANNSINPATGAITGNATSVKSFTLSARPSFADDDPAGSNGSANVPGGSQLALPNANSNRMLSTGSIAASRMFILGTEFLWVRGPFSLQGEYGWNFLDSAVGFPLTGQSTAIQNPTSPLALLNANRPAVPTNYVFNGGYVQLAYTLTGEARGYDRKIGTLSRQYFPQGPFTNAWVVMDECGKPDFGWGAWEVACRFSHTDLNDGVGKTRIQGGIMDGISCALNWYLNPNVTIMCDWVTDHRYDLPASTTFPQNAGNTCFPGVTSGFGCRCQLSF